MSKKFEGVTVRKYPSGKCSIQIAFSFRGVECREVLSHLDATRPTAEKHASIERGAILDEIRRNVFNYADRFPNSRKAKLFGHAPTSTTVQEAQESIIADLVRAGRQKTTIANYKVSANIMNDMLGSKKRIVDLVPEDFRRLFRDNTLARKTWTNYLIPLRKSLNRAVMDGAINFNPLDRVDINDLVPAHEKPQPDPFSLAEIDLILKAADERQRNFIGAAFFTGLRTEEHTAILWTDVDFNALTIDVNKAAQLSIRSSETKPPKTSAGLRKVDILPRALEYLKKQQQISRWGAQHVFPFWRGREPFRYYAQITRVWRPILEAAGVRYRQFNQTRHTYASHMLSSGYNPLYVAQQMGHKSTAMLDVYSKWVDDWKDESESKYGT